MIRSTSGLLIRSFWKYSGTNVHEEGSLVMSYSLKKRALKYPTKVLESMSAGVSFFKSSFPAVCDLLSPFEKKKITQYFPWKSTLIQQAKKCPQTYHLENIATPPCSFWYPWRDSPTFGNITHRSFCSFLVV